MDIIYGTFSRQFRFFLTDLIQWQPALQLDVGRAARDLLHASTPRCSIIWQPVCFPYCPLCDGDIPADCHSPLALHVRPSSTKKVAFSLDGTSDSLFCSTKCTGSLWFVVNTGTEVRAFAAITRIIFIFKRNPWLQTLYTTLIPTYGTWNLQHFYVAPGNLLELTFIKATTCDPILGADSVSGYVLLADVP